MTSKTKCRAVEYKMENFIWIQSFSFYYLKKYKYIYINIYDFYVRLMLTIKQNPVVDTQKIKIKESIYHCRKLSSHKGKEQEKKKGKSS